MSKHKILAAKIALIASFSLSNISHAGIPVTDFGSIAQSTITAMENVAQTLTQIEQYASQLKQLEIQIRDNLAPAAYVWDQAQRTIGALQDKMNELEHYKNQIGSIDGVLSKYGNVSFYKNSECFSVNGCSDEFLEYRDEANEYQNVASETLAKSIDDQYKAIKKDANNLERLQQQAQSARGQMQALQAANQLASAQANQFLQIRQVMNSYLESINAKNLADQTKAAQVQAMHRKATTVKPTVGSDEKINFPF